MTKLMKTWHNRQQRSLQGENPPLHWQELPMCSTTCRSDFLSRKKTIHECVVLGLGQAWHSTAPAAAVNRGLGALQRAGFTFTRIKPAKAHQIPFCQRMERNLPEIYGLISIYVIKSFSFENSKASKAFILRFSCDSWDHTSAHISCNVFVSGLYLRHKNCIGFSRLH